ncbi:MAG: hypothetical protein ABI624_05430 [Casimicrobiaceae bacterium]
MSQTPFARPRQAGSATVVAILAVVLLITGYLAYRAYDFYRVSVAPVVGDVAKAAAHVSKAVALLIPYKLTKNPDEIAQQLKASLGIALPEGYVGAFGLEVQMLGQKQMQLAALIPKNASPAGIFEGGRNEIRFNPGASTIFLAAQLYQGDRDEMREAITRMVAGDGQAEPLQEVYIEAGGRKVAAYRGAAQSYGAWNTVVFVFLDEGRLFFAAGPKGSFDDKALAGALAALVAAHPANELLYQHPKPEVIGAPSSDPCGIPGLKGDFDIVVVSVHKGSMPLDIALDKSGNDVFREDVVVGTTAKPVVLVLMGGEPIVWNVGQAAGARIAGVLAEGQFRQAVIGLPKSTRLTTYSTADGPNACQYFTAERADSREYTAVQRRIKALFGRGIGTFLSKKAGGRFVVGDVNGEVAYSPDLILKSVALPDNVLPGGKRGLDRLVKEQAIRLATDEEVAMYVKGAAARLGQPVDKYRRSMDWRLRNGDVYVVLKEVELPERLAGADARTFILPAGTAKPGGLQGHNTFLQMDGFQCYGVGCS